MALSTKLARFSLVFFLLMYPFAGPAETHGTYGEAFDETAPVRMNGSVYAYPATDPTLSPYLVEITEGSEHWADVTFQNRLVRAIYVPTTLVFEFDGLEVTVNVAHLAGDEPETITVIPPPGYYAVPESLVVQENTRVIIEIHVIPMS